MMWKLYKGIAKIARTNRPKLSKRLSRTRRHKQKEVYHITMDVNYCMIEIREVRFLVIFFKTILSTFALVIV